MRRDLVSCHTAVRRLSLALPILGRHEPHLTIMLRKPDTQQLQRIRFRHLRDVHEALNQHQRPEVRIDTLLGYHRVALTWTTDLAGRPLEPTDLPEPTDRAVLDTVTTVLLWHIVRGFYSAQRLVQRCLHALEQDCTAVSKPG